MTEPTEYVELFDGVEVPAGYAEGLDGLVVTYDQKAADRAVRFYSRYCIHVKGEWAGRPFVLAPWQERRIIRPIFGLVGADGARIIRVAFVEIPRKNGKSLLGAGFALKTLYADGEMGAEVYSAAGDRNQAALVFDVAQAMVEEHADLKRRSRIYRGNNRRIVNARTHGFYRVISADAKLAHGFNTHAAVCDEVHVWTGDYVGSLLEALFTSTGSRRQSIIIMITTAGFDQESICYREYSRATKIRDGIVADPSYLPVIYEAPLDADFTDPEVWAMANPNLGVSVSLDTIQRAAARAAESPQDENAFRRLHLNTWTEQRTRWIPREKWDACTVDGLEIPAGARVCAGLDLSTREDTTSLVAAWYLPDERIAVDAHVWIPAENAARRERDEHVPYRAYADQGLCTLTPGNAVDYETILEYVLALFRRTTLELVGYDPWHGEMLRQYMEAEGIPTVSFSQNFRTMGEPTANFARLWRMGRLAHNGNALFRFQAMNTAVQEDSGGSLKPAKNRSGDRIDSIVAAIMATWLLTAGERGVSAKEIIS